MARIFISYKRKDTEKVMPLIEEIERRTGEKCWYDIKGIETAAQFASVISMAIDEAEVVLFMHSRHHAAIDYQNDWTVRELMYAHEAKKRVVLVKLDDAPLKNLFGMYYGGTNNIDVNDPVQKEKLFRDLGVWLGREVAASDAPAGKKTARVRPKWLWPAVCGMVAAAVLASALLFSGGKKASGVREMEEWEIAAVDDSHSDHDWVDLGLSVRWATRNIGSPGIEYDGFYFAWGEIVTNKEVFLPRTYQFRLEGDDEPSMKLKKYNTVASRGEVDDKIQLDIEDDAARANWGGSWRMPTEAECRELVEKCTWEWVQYRGRKGYKVSGNNRSIFIPASGGKNGDTLYQRDVRMVLWSSTLIEDKPTQAYQLRKSEDPTFQKERGSVRYNGHPIRAVLDKDVD